MKRPLLLIAIILAGLLLLVGGYRYLVREVETPPAHRAVSGLQAAVVIDELPGHLVAIRAANLNDALAALGYVHGLRNGWPLLLWRQAALGRQAEWFGALPVPLDSLIHALLVPEQARAAYEHLPQHTQALLDGYARGLQTALQERAVRLRDELTLLQIPVAPWEPWHSLAVERLLALLMLPDTLDAALPELSALRAWLHLYGFRHSLAWVRPTPDGARLLFMRYVYGDLALPFFQEVLITLPDDTLRLVTVPGTLLFPAGQTNRQAWYLLPRVQPPTLEVRPRNALALQSIYARFRLPDGDERLLRRELADDALVLTEVAPDTVRLLRWVGLAPVSDLPAWLALLTDSVAAFRLFAGDGLLLTDESYRLLGQPPVVEPLGEGVLIGQTDWHRWIARRLRTLPPSTTPPDDAVSTWAQEQLAALLPALDTLAPPDSLTREAYTLLRNWNAAYDAASIGATIFDHWLFRYRQRGGTSALRELPDSLRIIHARLLAATFREAVDTLAHRLGPDLNLWRWERTHPRRLAFPIWSHLPDLPAATRYAPLVLPGEGHPSTIRWGYSPLLQERPAPAFWEGWTIAPGTSFYARRLWPEVDRFLARYRLSARVTATALQGTAPLRTLRLTPR
ncbi:penicillin acylase family protein [Rhodothermus marinus]|uniref:penicillin acylase family protein n=1 Tax=Rhodothermus marinus TaxID=29549 RepID=UPI0012BA42E1|nr:penicillin acylase family protein [Rhodothermus marinus]BBM73031.1 penicillin amidase [Rhodothermus marinus]